MLVRSLAQERWRRRLRPAGLLRRGAARDRRQRRCWRPTGNCDGQSDCYRPPSSSRPWQPPLLCRANLEVVQARAARATANRRLILNEIIPIFEAAGGAVASLNASAVDAGNGQKLVRLETRAAHQRAVNVSNAHQLLGIRRLDRSAVQDTRGLPLLCEPRLQALTDEPVHLGDIGRRRRQPGADRPDRLVGKQQIFGRGAVRYRTLELRAYHRECACVLALSAGLAYADDGAKSGAPRSQRLGPHICIGFMVITAPFGVPDDDGAGARVLEHFGRKVAGERSASLGVAILCAKTDARPLERRRKQSEQRGGRTYHHVHRRELLCTLDDPAELRRRGAQAVHLPVPRHQRARRANHGRSCAFSASSQAVSRAPAATPEVRRFAMLRCGGALPYDARAVGWPRVLSITDDACFEGCEKPLPTGSAKRLWPRSSAFW